MQIDPSLAEAPDAGAPPAEPVAPIPEAPPLRPTLIPGTPLPQVASDDANVARISSASALASPDRALTDAGTGFFRDSGELPRYPTDATDAIQPHRQKRTLVIALLS